MVKRQGWPPRECSIGYCLLLWITLSFAWSKFQDACFLQFVTLHSRLDPPALCVLFCPACEYKALSAQITLLFSGEQVWSEFQRRETRCTKPVHKEHWPAPWFTHPISGRSLWGKNKWVASQRKPDLVLGDLIWVFMV